LEEAKDVYTVVFVDPSVGPKVVGKFNNAAEAKKLIRDSFNDMYDTGDHLRNVAPGIYVLEEDYRNTGERATAKNYKHFYHWIIQTSQDVAESDEQLLEGIKDTASATAVIACLLAGGGLSGCATAPQQTTTAQIAKTGQDLGRVVYNAKNITRAGTEEELRQEMRNIIRGMGNRPEELNKSAIIRVWRKLNKPTQFQEPITPPENQPAPPQSRQQFEAKEILSKEDFVRERDRLLRMIGQESNPANKQILKSAIKQLENQAEQQGWLTIQQRMIREDTAALAAEDAILKRIFVRHRDLMMEYGPDKITQAAESVAYNVGDIAHITDEQINEWVGQVEYILGARP
jgi:hypothetical protein